MRPTRPTRSLACAHHSLNNPAALHYTIHTCHVALLDVTTPYGPEIIQAGSVLVAVLCIANTAEPLVSDHPKCEHLVVAKGGSTVIIEEKTQAQHRHVVSTCRVGKYNEIL